MPYTKLLTRKRFRKLEKKMATKKKFYNPDDPIRDNLQRVFNEALEEEFPQEFADLIARLSEEKKSREAKGKAQNDED